MDKFKALLLDLDGTIRQSTNGKFIKNPNDQEPIEGSIEAMEIYHQEGWTMIGITNQGGVDAGYKSLKSAIEEQLKTLEIFPWLSCIYFCPDFKGRECFRVRKCSCVQIDDLYPDLIEQFRKPNPGMIFAALRAFAEEPTVLMVGDREEDKLAAKNAGINFLDAHIWSVYPFDLIKEYQMIDVFKN